MKKTKKCNKKPFSLFPPTKASFLLALPCFVYKSTRFTSPPRFRHRNELISYCFRSFHRRQKVLWLGKRNPWENSRRKKGFHCTSTMVGGVRSLHSIVTYLCFPLDFSAENKKKATTSKKKRVKGNNRIIKRRTDLYLILRWWTEAAKSTEVELSLCAEICSLEWMRRRVGDEIVEWKDREIAVADSETRLEIFCRPKLFVTNDSCWSCLLVL